MSQSKHALILALKAFTLCAAINRKGIVVHFRRSLKLLSEDRVKYLDVYVDKK